MKLSELVNFKNELDKLSVLPAQRAADQEVARVTHLIESFPLTAERNNDFMHSRFDIKSKFQNFENELNDLKLAIKLEIEQLERPWFQESYRLYDEEMRFESSEYILDRRPNITEETKRTLQARLHTYSSWQHPGMILRPGRESFIQDMVSFDPLYLVDQSHELLEPAIVNYPIEYQRRLRSIVVNEYNDAPFLTRIPDHQIGLCVAYNYFNFRPLEVIRKYLEEIYQKLKPGGTLIMTFNDCDRDKAVMLVEQHFACYTPGTLIRELASTIGYEHVFDWNDGGPSTWLEIKKPGALTTLRGGQTLAKIVHKSVAKSK